jgi:tetratricopeptide (TPR) repeat protein
MIRSLPLCLLLLACGADRSDPQALPDPLDRVTAEQLFRGGVHFARAGDYTRAEQYLTAAMDRGYPEERAMPVLMQTCVQASRLAAALAYARPYLERHPEQWSLRLLVASIHMGLDEPERAREELARVLRDAPEEPAQAHYFLGVLYRDRFENVETAREHFRRYLALEPEGSHREEARASLPVEELGLPVRVPMEEVEAAP